jgi:excisionase family DNA binding protein
MTPSRRPPDTEAAPPIDDGGFLSRSDVARIFGVSTSTVTRWARAGLIQSIRTPGGQYRFRTEEIRKAAGRAAAGDLVKLD